MNGFISWGLPTESKYPAIIPEDEVPEWKNSMIKQQNSDDL